MKKNIVKNGIQLLAILLLGYGTLMAQHNHGSHNHGGSSQSHQPPHGGQMKEAGKYQIEMVTNLSLIHI